MIIINITGVIVGTASLFEEKNRQGRRFEVPTYRATMLLQRMLDSEVEFAVTRDATDIVLGRSTDRYGKNGECPPSLPCHPYEAVVHEKKDSLPFALRLYERSLRNQHHLRGRGSEVRSGILIHHGPARSEGCFTIAGGDLGFYRWRQQFEGLMRYNYEKILVIVQERDASHLPRHLVAE